MTCDPPNKHEDPLITLYWLTHYLNEAVGLCGLCGNTGLIDTRGIAISPAGVHAGGLHFCLCPNGQIRRAVAAQWDVSS